MLSVLSIFHYNLPSITDRGLISSQVADGLIVLHFRQPEKATSTCFQTGIQAKMLWFSHIGSNRARGGGLLYGRSMSTEADEG